MIDRLIIGFDKALRTVFTSARTGCPVPGEELPEAALSEAERRHAAALMRINHSGEVCAQALYRGQAAMSRDGFVHQELLSAAQEEMEHLAWTERRITELGGRRSALNPLWYGGAFAIGVLAGRCGDRWNLGFLAETERQVEAHLGRHLDSLPAADAKSRAIVSRMKEDEAGHAESALRLGAARLPGPLRGVMRLAAKVMTGTAYHV